MDEVERDEPTYPRFISDIPAEKDSFLTHSAIAQAISDAIETNRSLRIIGLLGRWGSGKSTVVKFVENNLMGKKRGEASYKFFTYDAWLHQSDPPRLAFIKNLIDYLEAEDLADGGQWDEDWKRLSGQLKLIDKVDTPILSYDAKWLFVSFLIFVFGASLFKFDLLNGAFSSPPNEIAKATLFASAALILLPILAWIARVNYVRHEKGKSLSWFPPFLVNKSFERTSTRIEESPDPNSIEFGKSFRRILLDLQERKVHLVVVIDNIDRIGAKNAFEIWSSVRSFFLGHNFENTSNSFRSFHPTVLLPVDDQAIQRVFTSISHDDEASHSFVEKTFDATFVVSEPVTSDWRAYLEGQAKWALGDLISDKDIFWIGRFLEVRYRTRKSQTAKRITPRIINNVINKVVSLAMQWRGSDLKVVSFAYFSIFTDDIQGNIYQFVRSDPEILGRANEEWRNEIAALHFGVEKSVAAQILLEDPLVQSIHEEDEEAFSDLASWPSFGTVFERIAGGEIFYPEDANEAFSFYRKASSLLLTLSEDVNDHYWLKLSWDNLGRNLEKYVGQATYSANTLSGIGKILARLEPSYAERLAKTLHGGVGQIIGRVPDLFDATMAAGLVDMLKGFFETHDREFESYVFDGPTSNLLHILGAIANQDALLDVCRFDLNRDDLPTEFVTLASNAETANEASNVLAVFSMQAFQKQNELSELNWNPVGNFATNLVASAAGSSPFSSHILGLLHFLAAVSDDERKRVLTVMQQGHPANRLKEAMDQSIDSEKSAGFSLAIWSNTPIPTPSSGYWDSRALEEHIDEQAVVDSLQQLVDQVTIDPLAQHAESHPSSITLIRRLLKHQIVQRDIGPVYLDRMLKNISFYLNAVPSRMHDTFIERIVNYRSFIQTLKSMEWSETLHDLSVHINAVQSEKIDEILGGLADKLGKTEYPFIERALRQGDHPFPTINELILGREVYFGANDAFTKSLIKYAKEGPSVSTNALKRFQKLVSLLNGYSQRKVMNAIASFILGSAATKVALKLASFFGRPLLKNSTFVKRADDTLDRLVLQFLDLKDGRDLLRANTTLLERWIREANAEAKNRLAEKLEAMKLSKNSHRSEFAHNLSASLKHSLK